MIVFARTKHGADKLHRDLDRAGIKAAAIHGNKSQAQRERALAAFKSPRPPVLIATDIAARGIDVDNVAHVINYELPHEPETYVHRIGRTGRAGQEGAAVSFCDAEERSRLTAIERLLRRAIPARNEPPAYAESQAEERPRSGRSGGNGPRSAGEAGQRRRRGGRPRTGSVGTSSRSGRQRPAKPAQHAVMSAAAAGPGGPAPAAKPRQRKHRLAL